MVANMLKSGFKTGLVSVLVIAGGILAGCSDDPASGNDQATVSMQAELATAKINQIISKDRATSLAGAEVDSMKISRVRILVSELKLHRDNEDTVAGDKNVKIGPMIVTVDSAGARVFAVGTVPSGDYDKVKFEFHRFSASEVAGYLGDPNFADFVTNDRWTVIIDGVVYVKGVETPFTYRSDMTANLSLKFDTLLSMGAGATVVIVVQVDPIAIFKDGGKVLDPRDGSNESRIDNAIKSAIKALKR